MTASGSSVSAARLREMLGDGVELALIDVREQGLFGREHLFRAVNIPAGCLPLRLPRLVPNADVRMVLVDEDGEMSARATAVTAALGYRNVAILEGGARAWVAAGYECYSGVNVPSKAFGEFVETRWQTPHVTAAALDDMIRAGEDLVILDSRPFTEFHNMSIPGGICTPGAELVRRVKAVVPDDTTPVVVNCAGRTRSIIGAQSLINAGLPNPVMALKDGTMGWHLAGLALDHGAKVAAPDPAAPVVAWAQDAAARVRRRFDVPLVTGADIDDLKGDKRRTLFVLDVRTADEFAAGHLPGSFHAPGGQLVQATDEYVGVANARLVLVDDDEVRASMTASWLLQMGWPEVLVLAGGIAGGATETGSASPLLEIPAATAIAPAALYWRYESGEAIVILDLANSREYQKGHIPGAWWGLRSRIDEVAAKLGSATAVVVTSEDGLLAHFGAADLGLLVPDLEIAYLEGGTDAWVRSAYRLDAGLGEMTTTVDDNYLKPYENKAAAEAAMQGYLDWEVALIAQMDRDGIDFSRFIPERATDG